MKIKKIKFFLNYIKCIYIFFILQKSLIKISISHLIKEFNSIPSIPPISINFSIYFRISKTVYSKSNLPLPPPDKKRIRGNPNVRVIRNPK